jgi:hypothetical protein
MALLQLTPDSHKDRADLPGDALLAKPPPPGWLPSGPDDELLCAASTQSNPLLSSDADGYFAWDTLLPVPELLTNGFSLPPAALFQVMSYRVPSLSASI